MRVNRNTCIVFLVSYLTQIKHLEKENNISRTVREDMRSAKLNSGQDFSVESGNVNEKRCVLTITVADFLSFLVVGNGACTASAAEAASGIRAIRLGSLIWLAVTLGSGLRVFYTGSYLSQKFTLFLSFFHPSTTVVESLLTPPGKWPPIHFIGRTLISTITLSNFHNHRHAISERSRL